MKLREHETNVEFRGWRVLAMEELKGRAEEWNRESTSLKGLSWIIRQDSTATVLWSSA